MEREHSVKNTVYAFDDFIEGYMSRRMAVYEIAQINSISY